METFKSCALCKFLYRQDNGYSNYTVEETEVRCAKDRNPNLPADEPWDWKFTDESDNWPKTNQSACELFAAGQQVGLDVDGECGPADCTDDQEVIDAVCAHSGIGPRGYESFAAIAASQPPDAGEGREGGR